jgi:hypothetical protein
MASANVLITYSGDSQSLNSTINKINDANDDAVKSAQKSADLIVDAYKNAIKGASTALKGDFLKNAINGQVKLIKTLGDAGVALKPLKDSLDETNKKLKLIVKNEDDLKKLEDRLRKLSLEGKRNTEEFDKTARAIGEYKAAIIAADRAVDLYAKSTDAATGRIGELEDKLYDLALAGKSNTTEFNTLIKEVAKLKRGIVETDAQVDALVQRGRGLTGFVQSVELVGVAFQAVEGAAALVGDESEDLQKTLVKLNALIAITSALEQGRTIILEQLRAKTGLVAVATKLYSFVTEGATLKTKAFRATLVASGIGAVVVLLGLLAEKIFATGEASDDAAQKANDYAKGLNKVNDVVIKSNAEQEIALNNLAKAREQISEAEAEANERTIKVNESLKTSLDQTLSDIEERRNLYYTKLEDARKNDNLSESDLIGTQIKLRDAFEKDRDKLIEAGAKRAGAIRTQAITDEIEANKKLADELASDRLKAAEQRIRQELAIDGESQSERIRLAQNLAKQEVLNAQQSIKNEDLKAATIGRINAELANEIAAIKLDEQKKAIELQVLQLENVSAIGNATLQQEIDLANKRAELAKKEAESETDPVKRAELVKKAETDAANTIRDLNNQALAQELALNEARVQLRQATGDLTLQTQEDLINAQFAQREQALISEAAQTIEGQKKLAVDLELLETEKQDALTGIRIEYANKELEIENIKIRTLQVLGIDSSRDRIKLAQNELEQKKKLIDAELISQDEKNAKIALAEAETSKTILEERKKLTKSLVDIGQETASLFSGFAQAASDQSNNIIEQIQLQSEVELEAINTTNQSEQDKQRQRVALELRTNKQIAAEKTKQAKLDRAVAAFNVVVNTASYIIRLGEQLGILAPPFQVAAGVLGAAQLAVITSQPLPKFKKGGMVGGKSHEQGGTIIEAEKGEFIMNKNSTSHHRKALDAMNTSSSAFRKYIEDRYVRPALLEYAMNGKDKAVVVNASLNSKSMEKKLDKLNKSMKSSRVVVNISGNDSRYQWHNN